MKKDIQQENKELKRKLQIAESWMKKEVQNQIITLQKNGIYEVSNDSYAELISSEMESIITQRIQWFFSNTSLYNIPESFINSLIKSEISFYIFQKWIQIDALAITIWYQKCLESIIEMTITDPFRLWAKNNISPTKSQTLIEDTLKKVIEKNYILGIGKIYQLLEHIKRKEKNIWTYEKWFSCYLENDASLKNTLMSNSFLLQLERVVESEVFWSKRHTGEISESEVHEIRSLCVWNLSNTDCLIHKLFTTQSIL